MLGTADNIAAETGVDFDEVEACKAFFDKTEADVGRRIRGPTG